MFFKRSEI